MKMLLPIIMLLIGAAAGIGAGVVLKPDPQEIAVGAAEEKHEMSEEAETSEKAEEEQDNGADYVTLNNQFIVPVVRDERVESLVVLSLAVELDAGNEEEVYKREPKLRDALLQVMFDHANIGGFRGKFTDGNKMDVLRLSLTEAAQSVIGSTVQSIVITSIARQDT